MKALPTAGLREWRKEPLKVYYWADQSAVTKVYQRVAMKVEQMVHLWEVKMVATKACQMAAQMGLISVVRTVA